MGELTKSESDFARLLATGWPRKADVARPSIGGLPTLLASHQLAMAAQLINSAVPEARAFWRAKYPDLVPTTSSNGGETNDR